MRSYLQRKVLGGELSQHIRYGELSQHIRFVRCTHSCEREGGKANDKEEEDLLQQRGGGEERGWGGGRGGRDALECKQKSGTTHYK